MTQLFSQTTRPGALPRDTPESQGLPSGAIGSFLDVVAASEIELHSLMVLRHGTVVAEGWWAPYEPDGIHLLYSLSKSFTSTAIGLAAAEGLLSIDDLVTSFFPELDVDTLDPKVRRMQVRHLLSMASGHREDTIMHIRQDDGDPVVAFLTLPPEEEPGTWFTYNQGCTLTLSVIITRLTGLRVEEFLQPRLFAKLGIDESYWAGIGPYDLGFSGLHLRTDAIARLGQLYLQNGVWEGEQLLSTEWVAEASRIQVDNPREPNPDWTQGYGFQFWMCRHDAYRGDGAYGQFCLVIPDQDAVLAITAATGDMQGILDAVWSELLPAYGDVLADDEVGAGSLRGRLGTLSLPLPEGSDAAGDSTADDSPWTASSGDDESPVRSVGVTSSAGGGWLLHVDDGSATYDVPCGFGSWTTRDQQLADGSRFATAAAGAWSSATTLTIELAITQTPHRLTLVCDVAAGSLAASWRTAPLGPTRPSHLALTPR